MTTLLVGRRAAICCVLGGAGRGSLPFFITLYRRVTNDRRGAR